MIALSLSAPILLAAATPAAAKLPAAAPAAAATAPPFPDMLSNATFLSKTPLATNFPWVTHGLAGLFVILAVGLIALLAVQTTKQEGLSGTIGGRVESAYRPRLGFDQQLTRMTSWVAIAFVFVGFLLSLSGI
jgi:protein translocase SecG subunit